MNQIYDDCDECGGKANDSGFCRACGTELGYSLEYGEAQLAEPLAQLMAMTPEEREAAKVYMADERRLGEQLLGKPRNDKKKTQTSKGWVEAFVRRGYIGPEDQIKELIERITKIMDAAYRGELKPQRQEEEDE